MIWPAACHVEPLVSSPFSSRDGLRPPAFAGEMVGEARPHDSAADDDGAGVAGKILIAHARPLIRSRRGESCGTFAEHPCHCQA